MVSVDFKHNIYLLTLQDEFALRSHTLAHRATEQGLLTDRLTYKVPGGFHSIANLSFPFSNIGNE